MSVKKLFILFILSLFFVISCGKKGPDTKMMKDVQIKAQGIFAVIPDKMPGSENDTPAIIELGKKLYFDGRLSANDKIACNECHIIDGKTAGVDNEETSEGVTGEHGPRNSPTVLNAGFQFAQFWDGREKDLKAQAIGPILNPIEMAMPDSNSVVKKIAAIDEYKTLFKNAGMKITFSNIAEAIAAFERTLITHDKFDDFLKGNVMALSEDEVKGLDLFISKGCITCHTGSMLGGNMFQKTGLVKRYADTKDTGRMEVTKNEADKFMFKVPLLRNVALTDPYFHDGEVKTLEEAVKIMADIQLAQQLSDQEVKKIVLFLNTLTDKNLAAANAAK